MRTYRTAEVAKLIGIHPNTVRLYERLQLVSAAEREENGYRVFTELHIAQFRLARLAFQVEVLQNGLRKKIVQVVRTTATGALDDAVGQTEAYVTQLRQERRNAEEAIGLVRQFLAGEPPEETGTLRRREVSQQLQISMDTLRNWEMNGLLTAKRMKNGYRVYTAGDIRSLKIIRALRCANYSLEAILRLMRTLASDPDADIRTALNTPGKDDDIISTCDRLIGSLLDAEKNALTMLDMLRDMKVHF